MEGTQMAKQRKKKQQQSYKLMQAIDTIEKAASMAVKMYKAVEPIIKTILTNGRRTK
jgi:hypothetical protein